MGITTSTPTLSREQQDIKYLGSRYAFGDEELYKLYRAYHVIRKQQESFSFLTDWAVHCTRLKPDESGTVEHDGNNKLEEAKKERLMLMQLVESKILPQGFSEKLEKAAFLLPDDNTSDHAPPSLDFESDESRLSRVADFRVARIEKFFDGVSLVGRRGGRAALGVLFDCCSKRQESDDEIKESYPLEPLANVEDLLDLGYRLALASELLYASNKCDDMGLWIPPANPRLRALHALGRSIVEFSRRKHQRQPPHVRPPFSAQALERGLVSKADFQEWSESIAPLLPSVIATFMHHVFFPEKPYPPSRTAFDFPKLAKESAFLSEPTSPILFSFACMSKSLGGTWHRLYTSTSDGLSFNRLQNALVGYGGPTLMIIEATNRGIFGAFTASAWKETKDFYGNSDCFLYQLLPMTAVYRPSGSGVNFMYCNSEARSRGYDGQAHGIGFGGNVDRPRLFIPESFDGCVASSQDLTFDGGPLLPRTPDGGLQKYFDIDSLEVWGVGGEDIVSAALGARNKQRAIQAANIRKARQVDKAAFLDDFRSGIIESKAFKYRDQIRGRADAAVDERHKNAYVYEK